MGRKRLNKLIQGGFVAMTWRMLNSKGYKALPASPAKVLPYFLGKVKDAYHPDDPVRYVIDFPFTYSEAKKYGFGKSTFFDMLRNLARFGFIDVKMKGGLRSQGGSANSLYRLSKRWENYGLPSFDEGEWRRYFPEKSQVLKANPTSPESEPF